MRCYARYCIQQIGRCLRSIKILIIDDHPTMRLGIKVLLNRTEDMYVVGESGDGEEALRIVKEEEPDLAILGLNLRSRLNSVGVCRKIKELPDSPQVLAYSRQDETNYIPLCRAGADGYVPKHVSPVDLLYAIRLLALGQYFWWPESNTGYPRSRVLTSPAYELLTKREREVLSLKLRGYRRNDIAKQLYLSCNTIKTHLKSITRKLGKEPRELR